MQTMPTTPSPRQSTRLKIGLAFAGLALVLFTAVGVLAGTQARTQTAADSATALVIHDRLVRSDFGDQQQYLRWVVELDRVDGRWLVDKFTAAQ